MFAKKLTNIYPNNKNKYMAKLIQVKHAGGNLSIMELQFKEKYNNFIEYIYKGNPQNS